MAGGSREQESETDEQCQFCGLWFGTAGVLNHEEHCDLEGFDARKVSLECPTTLLRAGEVEIGDDPAGEAEAVETESPDDLATDAPSPAPEGATGDPQSEMRADGGPMAVPEFSDSDSEAETAATPDEIEATCPGCGAPASVCETPSEVLPDDVVEKYDDLKTIDYICVPCSTDEWGNWTDPVEVFNT